MKEFKMNLEISGRIIEKSTNMKVNSSFGSITEPSDDYPYLTKKILCIKSYDSLQQFEEGNFYTLSALIYNKTSNGDIEIVEYFLLPNDNSRIPIFLGADEFFEHFKLITLQELRILKIEKILKKP